MQWLHSSQMKTRPWVPASSKRSTTSSISSMKTKWTLSKDTKTSRTFRKALTRSRWDSSRAKECTSRRKEKKIPTNTLLNQRKRSSLRSFLKSCLRSLNSTSGRCSRRILASKKTSRALYSLTISQKAKRFSLQSNSQKVSASPWLTRR